MRRGGLGSLIVGIWLIIGVIAAYQRGYFDPGREVACRDFADTVLTIVTGPLNYAGVNPKVDCELPRPSK